MERRDLYQDDLTEERYPSPAVRDEQSATQVLDPDSSADDGNTGPMPEAPGSGRPLGYPHGVPGGVHDDPETDADDDEDDEDDDEDELDDELND